MLPPPVEPVRDWSTIFNGKQVGVITQTRSYRFITPMFGGGSRPRKADRDLLVRGASIRGQLRFWWRATQGGRFDGDLGSMREAERSLWGSTSKSSLVDIAVRITNQGQCKNWPSTNHPVHRFAAVGQECTVWTRVEFDLVISFPEPFEEGIQAALWAWETFGGIGARTRRGFGALRLAAVDGKSVKPPGAQEVYSFIVGCLRKYVKEGVWPEGVPHLSPAMEIVVSKKYPSPEMAWHSMIAHLMSFRRGGRGSPKWPEAEEIRRLVVERARMVSTDKFPRAAFGLPIVFRLKRVGNKTLEGMPGGIGPGEQQPGLRLASPLLIRPIACRDGSVGVALILEGTGVGHLPRGLRLRSTEKGKAYDAPVEIDLLLEDRDVLTAFLRYVEREEK